MAKIIPNEECWIGFIPTAGLSGVTAGNPNTLTPSAAEIDAAVDITRFTVSINLTASGNTIPTPSLDSLFETTIGGTSQAQGTGDFYRDDAADTAWTTLVRGVRGYIVLGRFGLTGTTAAGKPKPIATNIVEVWPVAVTSRAASGMTSNTTQTCTVTFAIIDEPNEGVAVTA